MLQEELSKRLQIIPNGELKADDKGIIHYKGFLSLCPILELCFGEGDNPYEFFLHLDAKTLNLTVFSKL